MSAVCGLVIVRFVCVCYGASYYSVWSVGLSVQGVRDSRRREAGPCRAARNCAGADERSRSSLERAGLRDSVGPAHRTGGARIAKSVTM